MGGAHDPDRRRQAHRDGQRLIGKSEDVRTDASFVEVTVGDPEIADVDPLTDRSLSILGKKNGTARVSVYGEGKKLVGVFDVEVSYDTSQLGSELAQRFPHAGFRSPRSTAASCWPAPRPTATTVDQAMMIAKQFGAGRDQLGEGAAPQQVMLEVRFVEAIAPAGRELGVHGTGSGDHSIINIGTARRRRSCRSAASDLPISSAVGSRRAVGHRAVRLHGRPHHRKRRQHRRC